MCVGIYLSSHHNQRDACAVKMHLYIQFLYTFAALHICNIMIRLTYCYNVPDIWPSFSIRIHAESEREETNNYRTVAHLMRIFYTVNVHKKVENAQKCLCDAAKDSSDSSCTYGF